MSRFNTNSSLWKSFPRMSSFRSYQSPNQQLSCAVIIHTLVMCPPPPCVPFPSGPLGWLRAFLESPDTLLPQAWVGAKMAIPLCLAQRTWRFSPLRPVYLSTCRRTSEATPRLRDGPAQRRRKGTAPTAVTSFHRPGRWIESTIDPDTSIRLRRVDTLLLCLG